MLTSNKPDYGLNTDSAVKHWVSEVQSCSNTFWS